jgi:threonine dehydrogenase-like Zn-dependent dehydrogenase
MKAVVFTAREQAELVTLDPEGPLRPNEVAGPTLFTLVSPGTELAWGYQGDSFPTQSGYASVFLADEIGADVIGIAPGDILFCMGGHRSRQRVDAASAVLVPEGLPPDEAVLARLMGVSMTTLITTAARPGDTILVSGLGPVGYLAAQVFKRAGYWVLGSDPDMCRRELAARSGLKGVFPEPPAAGDEAAGAGIALVVECSGHEAAVLAACRAVRKRGEVVLVGVPWKRQTDLTAHEILHSVFHKYVVVRSGWEWELPTQTVDFRPHAVFGNFRTAMEWLCEGSIAIGDTLRWHDPHDPQAVYQDLLHRRLDGLFQLFDWRALNGL